MGDNQRTRFREQPFQVPKIGTVKTLSLDLIVSLLIAMYSTVGGTISQKMYNGHKQTLVGIDNRQQPQSATKHCPIVV